jgi:hypothetical protein
MLVPGTAAVSPEAGTQATPSPETPPAAGSPFAPGFGVGHEMPYAPPFSEAQAYAASRVAGPSTALIVTAVIGMVLTAASTLNHRANVDVFQRMVRDQGMQFPAPIGPMAVTMGGIVQLLFAILILIGAIKMKRLESYGLAIASAILAMIPCTFGGCCVLGLPFGIWALVVLSDIHVRSAFRT